MSKTPEGQAAKKEAHPEFACYAESRDGIHWTKPELGQHEFNGSKRNNIIIDRKILADLAVRDAAAFTAVADAAKRA